MQQNKTHTVEYMVSAARNSRRRKQVWTVLSRKGGYISRGGWPAEAMSESETNQVAAPSLGAVETN